MKVLNIFNVAENSKHDVFKSDRLYFRHNNNQKDYT